MQGDIVSGVLLPLILAFIMFSRGWWGWCATS